MRTRRTVVAAAAALFVTGAGGLSFAAESVGKAVAVTPAAAAGSSGTRTLAVQDPVFMGDLVKTGSTGQVQLAFVDNTRMIVGPGSQLAIDAFVFQGHATAGRFSVNAVRGAFRFITGASPKQAYAIKTPTATIGVQGTRFDFSVGKDGTTNLALYDGSVRLCDRGKLQRKCTVLSGACSVIVLAPNHGFRWVKDLNQRKALMDKAFPYAFKQAGLRSDFQVNSGRCNVTYSIQAPPAPGPSNPVGVAPAQTKPSAPPPPPPPPPPTPPPPPNR